MGQRITNKVMTNYGMKINIEKTKDISKEYQERAKSI